MTHQATEIDPGTIAGTLTIVPPTPHFPGRIGIGFENPSFAIEADGSIRLTEGGSVRIGSTGDSGGRMRIHHTARDNDAYIDYYEDLHFRSGSSSSADRVIITSGGSVGIGEFDPSAKLEVKGDILTEIIRVTSTANVNEICDEAGQNCKDVSGGWSTGTLQTLSAASGTITLSDSGGSVTCEEITGDAGLCDGVDDVGLTSYTDTDTDTNATSICPNNQFLDGDGQCRTAAQIVTDGGGITSFTDTNAKTLCNSGEFLAGDDTTNCMDAAEIVSAGGGSGSGGITRVTGSAPLTFSGCTSGTCTIGIMGLRRGHMGTWPNTYFNTIYGSGYSSSPNDLLINGLTKNDHNFDLEVHGQGKVLFSSGETSSGGTGILYFPSGGTFRLWEAGTPTESEESWKGDNSASRACAIMTVDGGSDSDWCDGTETVSIHSILDPDIFLTPTYDGRGKPDDSTCLRTGEMLYCRDCTATTVDGGSTRRGSVLWICDRTEQRWHGVPLYDTTEGDSGGGGRRR